MVAAGSHELGRPQLQRLAYRLLAFPRRVSMPNALPATSLAGRNAFLAKHPASVLQWTKPRRPLGQRCLTPGVPLCHHCSSVAAQGSPRFSSSPLQQSLSLLFVLRPSTFGPFLLPACAPHRFIFMWQCSFCLEVPLLPSCRT